MIFGNWQMAHKKNKNSVIKRLHKNLDLGQHEGEKIKTFFTYDTIY